MFQENGTKGTLLVVHLGRCQNNVEMLAGSVEMLAGSVEMLAGSVLNVEK